MGGKPDLEVIFDNAFKERTPQPWPAEAAACRGMDANIFFPGQGGNEAIKSSKLAKATCAQCPVMLECREWAIENNERYGIWGGWGEIDRRRERQRRKNIHAVEDIDDSGT